MDGLISVSRPVAYLRLPVGSWVGGMQPSSFDLPAYVNWSDEPSSGQRRTIRPDRVFTTGTSSSPHPEPFAPTGIVKIRNGSSQHLPQPIKTVIR